MFCMKAFSLIQQYPNYEILQLHALKSYLFSYHNKFPSTLCSINQTLAIHHIKNRRQRRQQQKLILTSKPTLNGARNWIGLKVWSHAFEKSLLQGLRKRHESSDVAKHCCCHLRPTVKQSHKQTI